MPNPENIENHKFKKGQSGNPNGRPKKLPKLEELLAEVLGDEKDGLTAAEAILKALRAKAIKGDIRAAELLLDRAYGKPKNGGYQENDASEDEQRAAILERNLQIAKDQQEKSKQQ